MTTGRVATFDHLEAMTDERGLFEHADRTRRRTEHGYCTDDNARMLLVTSRELDAGPPSKLSRIALAFTLAAQVTDGRTRNRMNISGRWTDRPTTDDCWGRSVWGLGAAATHHEDPTVKVAARTGFDVALRQRSRWPRAMAFAALGAADVLASDPSHDGARGVLRDAIRRIGTPADEPWVWPQPRLDYANAALAEAMIAGGAALDDTEAFERGLAMLKWLLEFESTQGHLSVTGVGGRSQAQVGPQFDQQPIEVAAMADACWRAWTATGDRHWLRGIELAAGWFEGVNDVGVVMRDTMTGGSFDGLRVDGVNLNEGAESTLALISTMQRARLLEQIAVAP